MIAGGRLPFYATAAEVVAPPTWTIMRIVDAYEQLPVGRRYDLKSSHDHGSVPVIDQSVDGILGYHDDEPGVTASKCAPVVTFANHTCAMRVMREPFSVIQNVFPMVGKPGVCETLFLYYATKGRQQTEEYKGHHPAWRNSFFALPDLGTQRLTVAVLASIDDLIENHRRRIKLLEQMAQAIYREWFVRFRYPGREDAPLVDSPLGSIPEGWRVGTLDQLVNIVTATVAPHQLDPDTPAVGLEHIPRRRLTLDDWGAAGELGSRKTVFEAGDVLFGKIRPYFHKVSIVPMNGVCSTDAIVMRPSPDYWGTAVFNVASDEFVANATQTSNGTKMPRADWKVLKEFPVVLAPVPLARQFTRIAKDALGAAQRLMFANRKLAAMRDLLLPRLVSGQIDVSKLDLDAIVDSVA